MIVIEWVEPVKKWLDAETGTVYVMGQDSTSPVFRVKNDTGIDMDEPKPFQIDVYTRDDAGNRDVKTLRTIIRPLRTVIRDIPV